MFQPLIYSEKFFREDAYDAAHHSAFPKQSIFAGEPGIGLGPPAAPPALPPRPRVRLVEPGGARLERAHGPGAARSQSWAQNKEPRRCRSIK